MNNFLGMVGPGVRRAGLDGRVFSDHTDIRPTMLALLGMTDDYVHDGRVLVEQFDNETRKAVLQGRQRIYQRLADAYKQINAPVGTLGLRTLQQATTAIEGDDASYGAWLHFIAGLAAQRDALAAQIKLILDDAVFSGRRLDTDRAERLVHKAEALLGHRIGEHDD